MAAAPDMSDEFLHRIRVRPQPRFANGLKIRLDQSTGEHSMSGYIHAGASISRRGTALFVIIGLHVAIILAFTSGLVQKVTEDATKPFVVNFRQVERPPVETPSLPRLVLKESTIAIPTPPVPIEFPTEAPTGSESTETLVPTYSGTASQSSAGSFKQAGLGANFPDPDSFYPPSAVRQEIEGKAVVRVCIGPDGRLAEAPRIAQSTQNRLLDEAALRVARAGRYVAGSRDGVPITDCFSFQTTFQLKNRR